MDEIIVLKTILRIHRRVTLSFEADDGITLNIPINTNELQTKDNGLKQLLLVVMALVFAFI